MSGLDLKNFKKVASNKNYTVMRSDKGHEIRIAHNGLSSHRKSQLDNLPLYQADGTQEDDSDDVDTAAPDTQEPSQAIAPPAPATPQPATPPQDVTSPNIVTPPQTLVEQAQQQTSGAPDPNLTVQQRQEFLKADQAWAQDLANGHITPSTYSSLFAKKDTLGKIGTIFGLMLSGAGSGLAHQPNAALAMMNKELENDMTAQQTSKANAMNFLRLNQAQQLQQAQIGQIGAQTGLTNVETKGKSFALANMYQNRAALHHLVTQNNKLPVGSTLRMQGDQMLGMLNQQVNSENYNIADRAAIAAGLTGAMSQQSGNQPSSEQRFQQTDRALRLSGNMPLAQDMESKHYPGLQGQASNPISGTDKEKLDSGFQFQQQLDRFTNWAKNHSGDLHPSEINAGRAMAADLQGAYRQATHGGVYKEGEQNFISKLIDQEPTKFFNNIRVLPQLKALSTENQGRINETAKHLGFDGYTKPSSGASVSEGATGTHNGKPVVFSNGKWNYR
jgi:hypothetical protein